MNPGSSFGVTSALARVAEIRELRPSAVPATPGAAPDAAFASALARSMGASGGLAGAPPGPVPPIAPSAVPTAPSWALAGAGVGAAPGTVLAPLVVPIAAPGVLPAGAVTPTGAVGAPSPSAARRIAAASGELGVAESPPGSNDGPRIAQYRTATAGAGVGPWCCYFVSWVGAQAGTPLGPGGRGEGWVPGLQRHMRAAGTYVDASQGARPGDLVFFDRNRDGTLDHIGLVERVAPDGRVHTIEGNSSDAVRRRDYRPDEIAGYGRLP